MYKTTPVIRSDTLSNRYKCEVWLKLELENTTGSHKDRESREIIEECRQDNIHEIGCASTGNFGVSLAYYAMISNLKCHVWLSSKRTHPSVMSLLRSFSAEIHLTESDLSELYSKSSEEMHRREIYDVNPGECPAKITGNKAIGQEIIKQIGDVDAVVCCINNGTHLLGIADSMKEKKTRIIGIYSYSEFASSIRGFNKAEGERRIQEAVSTSGGDLIEARDQDLRSGVLTLYNEGIIPEVSSAGAVGVLDKLDLSGCNRICCVISGNGLKKPSELQDLLSNKR
ncbi:PLP-dependent lyase/thiolase [Chloroflexota bacterium]